MVMVVVDSFKLPTTITIDKSSNTFVWTVGLDSAGISTLMRWMDSRVFAFWVMDTTLGTSVEYSKCT